MQEIIYSIIFIEILGVIFFPIAFTVFWRLPDRGYSFSKLLILLIWAYIIWILGSLNDAFNTNFISVIVLLVIFFISLSIFIKKNIPIMSYLRKEYRMIIAIDISFIIIFTIWIFIRNLDPDIYHTEQIMDFTILNAVMSYSHYPPVDLWFSGNSINYYYYGYLIFGVFANFLNIDISLAYNIIIALIAGLSSMVLFGLIWNVSASFRFSKKLMIILSISTIIIFNFFSNSEPILELLNSLKFLPNTFLLWVGIDGLHVNLNSPTLFPNDHYWWWRATRVINTFDISTNASLDYTITEFPFFSFALADLHPHLISIPFYFMFVSFLYNLVLFTYERISNVKLLSISDKVFYLFLSLTFGSLIIINIWNLPSILILFAVTMLITFKPKLIHLIDRIKSFLYILFLSLLMFLPFYINFHSPVSGFDTVNDISSRFIHLNLIWGSFLLIIAFFLLSIYFKKIRYLKTNYKIAKTFSLVPLLSIILLWTFVILVDNEIESNLLLVLLNKNLSLCLILALWIFVSYLIIAKNPFLLYSDQKFITSNSIHSFYFLLGIIFTSLCLIVIPEYFKINDQFGNRMNTIFKLGFQSWLLLIIPMPFLTYYLYTIISTRLKTFFIIGCLFISFTYLYYFVGFINLQSQTWSTNFNINVHQNLKVENNSTYKSIIWIKNNLPNNLVVLEAPGESYNVSQSIISSFTGHPTVLGWIGHESQWRPSKKYEISVREKDIENIYLSNNTEYVKTLIDKYKISYIYVGEEEINKYGDKILLTNTYRDFGKLIYASKRQGNNNYIYIYDVSTFYEQ